MEPIYRGIPFPRILQFIFTPNPPDPKKRRKARLTRKRRRKLVNRQSRSMAA